MEIHLLGQVGLILGPGGATPAPALARPQQWLVLAALAADAGRLVPRDLLIDRVWGASPPEQARPTLYTHIARLRKVLGADRIERVSGGYRLVVDTESVDVHRFGVLVRRAAEPGRSAADRAALLRTALGCWKGEPLAGLPGEWAVRTREQWRLQRLDAALAWAEAELALRRPAAVVALLADLAVEHPLAETLAATHMRALAMAGRVAEALSLFDSVRCRLAEELGVSPGPRLRQAHTDILRAEPPAAETPAETPFVVPAQLPLRAPGFAGREAELARLDRMSRGESNLAILSGMPGVGKTALAVEWAHRAKGSFPDGQIFLDLNGFGPAGRPLAADEALAHLLEILGVPRERIPLRTEGMVMLYRSVLAPKRMLVVLDNARDAEQVRPLLPGGERIFVVVTSRRGCASLIAGQAARLTRVDPLPRRDSLKLLAARIGAGRLGAEPAAGEAIAALCGHLPLALAVVAARAATQPAFSLDALAEELRAHELDAVGIAEAAADTRTAFSYSYQGLSDTAARVFRLIGLHPGAGVAAAVAAACAGMPVDKAQAALAELVSSHLLNEIRPGRFAMHDLLRAYALELAERFDGADELLSARSRLLDQYAFTAHQALLVLRPSTARTFGVPAPPPPHVVEAEFADYARAMEWFHEERLALTEVVAGAADWGLAHRVAGLAKLCIFYLDHQARWAELIAMSRAVLDVAEQLSDMDGAGAAHNALARAYMRLQDEDAAVGHLRRALRCYTRLGDRTMIAYVHHNLAAVHCQRGRHDDASRHAKTAAGLFRAERNLDGLAITLNTMGWNESQRGEHRRAVGICRRALRLAQRLGDVGLTAITLDSLGFAYQGLDRLGDSIACYERAVELLRRLEHSFQLAKVLDRLGDARHRAGQPLPAASAWRQAVHILHELQHPAEADVARKLAGVGAV